jgi:hypothetical protein
MKSNAYIMDINEFIESMISYIICYKKEKFTFDRSFQLLLFGTLISNIDLSNRIRTKMTFIDVPHHLSMRTNEGPTPFLVTGDSFISSASNQFTSVAPILNND